MSDKFRHKFTVCLHEEHLEKYTDADIDEVFDGLKADAKKFIADVRATNDTLEAQGGGRPFGTQATAQR